MKQKSPTGDQLALSRKEIERRSAEYVARWDACQACDIHKYTYKHVYFRTDLDDDGVIVPSDFLFIGEAPGREEHDQGLPFVGETGQLLNCLFNDLRHDCRNHGIDHQFTIGIANVICCFPAEITFSRGGLVIINGFRQPTEGETNNCSAHLLELLDLTCPIGVIYMGKVAYQYARPIVRQWKKTARGLEVRHPAYLLRNRAHTDASVMYRKWYMGVRSFIGSFRRP